MFKWIVFHLVVFMLLMLDVLMPSSKRQKNLYLSTTSWACLVATVLYNLYIYFFMGHQAALQFFTAYFLEQLLSIDNLFVFLLIFSFFKMPDSLIRKALTYGIVGALVFRCLFIQVGVSLIQKFRGLIPILGVILILIGLKFIFKRQKPFSLKTSKVFQWLYTHAHFTSEFEGSRLWVRKQGALYFTPFLLTICMIELTDLIFALDSVPAVLSVTRDRFIAYTSNIFAILNLRSLYFLLSSSFLNLFSQLHLALGLILVFIGLKMGIEPIWTLPVWVVFLTILAILAVTIGYNICLKKNKRS